MRFILNGIALFAIACLTVGAMAQTASTQTGSTQIGSTETISTDSSPDTDQPSAAPKTPRAAQGGNQAPPGSTGPVQPLSPPRTLPNPLQSVQPLSPSNLPTRAGLTDEVERGDTVTGRPRPDYDPAGVPLGGFLLFPELLSEGAFNSNIYATPHDRKSDFILSLQPSVDLKSNWNNNALNFHADARVVRYATHSSENFEDYTLSTDGRIDVLHDLQLFGGLGYAVRHEPRGSPNDIGAREPQQYSVTSAKLGLDKTFNRLNLRLDANYDGYRYDPVDFGAGNVSQSGRNYDAYTMGLRTGYEFAPQRSIYALTSYNWRAYLHSVDVGGFDRDSRGFFLGIGTQYDFDGVIFLEGAIGFRHQNYDDARLDNLNGLAGKLKLTWNVTRLTTITGTASRDIEETILPFSSAYFATRADMRIDHELMRDVLLDAHAGYERDVFEGIDRRDSYYLAGFGAKLLLNRNFSLTGGYQFRHRNSDIPNSDFDENVIFLRLSSHL